MKTKDKKIVRKYRKPRIAKREKIVGSSGPCGRVCCADCGQLLWSS